MDQFANRTPGDITAFWKQAGPKLWFEKSDEFDQQIKDRFAPLPEKAATGALDHWMKIPTGSLALILVLDQFPRNIHRGSVKAWQYDEIAREKSKAAINAGHDKSFGLPIKRFFYIPYMHSEAIADQQLCLALCRAVNDEEGVKFAQLHLDIIKQFGRFPHRNEVLNRPSTPEEIAYLNEGGFAG